MGEGLVQKYYQHRVPKEKATGPRINLTWRWVKKHRPGCPHRPDHILQSAGTEVTRKCSLDNDASESRLGPTDSSVVAESIDAGAENSSATPPVKPLADPVEGA